MKILDNDIFIKATEALKNLYGEAATFRDGQYEAIEATLLNSRTLVVQKTGWGKSLVYFICTKLLRDNAKGVTFVVSPLLVLMENQIEAATKMGLKCDVLNSTVKERRADIIDGLINSELDLVLVTPETLFKDDIQNVLKNVNVGLFVVDEAHCISDWGHDFRLDYGNIHKIIKTMPLNVPVLATTATANDRVVSDLMQQLGNNVYVSKGPLMRKSLSIQTIKLSNKAERYAWILQNIGLLPGSGIIYCLTQRDCDYLADFLTEHGIVVKSYYSRDEDEYLNKEAEELFKKNKVKALVSTIKLGMGYDKGDIAFIIHFQQPSNIVSYYQQIGRAGRNIDRAYTFLMSGKEDKRIQDYFIDTAFPTEKEASDIYNYIYDNNDKGSTLGQITVNANFSFSRINKALMFLLNEGLAIKEKNKYYVTPKQFVYSGDYYSQITNVRKDEQEQMYQLIKTKSCYNRFIVNCLDDKTSEDCGICGNCLGYEEYPTNIDGKYLDYALQYIERLLIFIEPRKQWAITKYTTKSKIEFQNQIGLCLSRYGDVGYGELVKKDKYSQKSFCDELVGKSTQVLRQIIKENNIEAITFVPSLRSSIVSDFAKRLADSCGVRFAQLLEKSSAAQQKTMQNSSHQCENAYKSFSVIKDEKMPANILLVDDVIDSKWTMTVCGFRLMEAGCKTVFPFVLADSSQKED